MEKILLYGIGNPARQDDALGILFIEKIEDWILRNQISKIQTESNYQLNIEDAELISKMSKIIFIDASKKQIKNFKLEKIKTRTNTKMQFSTHSISPKDVAALCNVVFNKTPKIFLLHIKGYCWNFDKKPTSKAQKNLNKAFQYLIDKNFFS